MTSLPAQARGLPRRLDRPSPVQAEFDFVGDFARNFSLWLQQVTQIRSDP